jgi:hypothetical protein
MMRRTAVLMAVFVVVTAAAIAFVIVPAAVGGPARSGCSKAAVTALETSQVTDTSVVLSFSISSAGSGGSYNVDIWSPQTTGFDGAFPDGGGSFSHGLANLVPDTHYRGTLSVRNDCGGEDALIDFRTPKSPPRPSCSAPPVINDLHVDSISVDAAVVVYAVSSIDTANIHLTSSPGATDVTATVAPPSGSSRIPLSGLTPSTTYSVALTATNGCGESKSQTTFVTLRATDCTGPPRIPLLRVTAITEHSASVSFGVDSDGAGTARITVNAGRVDVSRSISAPGAAGRIPLRRLRPATSYTVELAVVNQCGRASVKQTFVSLGRIRAAVVGSGRIISSPSGISCPHSCTGHFRAASIVLLTALHGPGWRFVAWGGACHGTRPNCSLKARDARTTARFARRP